MDNERKDTVDVEIALPIEDNPKQDENESQPEEDGNHNEGQSSATIHR